MPSNELNIFLTGQPSIGKTTIIQAILKRFNGTSHHVRISGFYTEECRKKGGERVGFDIVYWDSTDSCFKREVLSRLSNSIKKGDPQVGKYIVDTKNVETFCVSSMANGGTSSGNELVIVDEVGKMEMLCPSFVPAVNELLDSKAGNDQRKRIILGTIPTPRYGRVIKAVEDIRDREDVIVLYVNKNNRDDLRETLSEIVGQHLLKEESKSFLEDLRIKLEPFLYHRPIGAPSMTADNKSKTKANSRQTSDSQDDSCVKDQCSEPCGPLKSDNPKTLILGETASPLPSNVEYSYCERSMWIVLGRSFGLDFKPIKDINEASKDELDSFLHLQRTALSKGICIWDVFGDVHEIGGGRNKRRKRVSKSNPNDIVAFLEKNHSIQQIAFIGKKTADAFKNTVTLPDSLSIEFITLPSSSAANSRMSIDEKAAEWKSSMEIGM